MTSYEELELFKKKKKPQKLKLGPVDPDDLPPREVIQSLHR